MHTLISWPAEIKAINALFTPRPKHRWTFVTTGWWLCHHCLTYKHVTTSGRATFNRGNELWQEYRPCKPRS